MEIICPNCGHSLVPYRKVQQKASTREVLLEWSICSHCRHVALNDWSFKESRERAKDGTRNEQQTKDRGRTRRFFSPWMSPQTQQRA